MDKKVLSGGKLAGGNPKRGRVENDYYATNPESTRGLLDNVEFSGNRFLEPCCGEGHICKVIQEYYPDADITAIDIADRGYGITGVNFLTYTSKELFDNIITNPPYEFAQEFIEHSLELVKPNGKVAMFLKVQFLEGIGRKEFFEQSPLKYVYVFRARQNPLRNGNPCDENGKKWSSSTMCFAWFIFEKGYKGEPVIRWIDKPKTNTYNEVSLWD